MRGTRVHSRWLLAIVGIALLAGIVLSVERLRSYVVAQYEIVTLLSDIGSVANRISALEWQAVSLGRVSSELGEAHDRQVGNLRRDARRLMGSGNPQELREVTQALTAYTAGVDAEFRALRAGRIELAREIDETRVDPMYTTLTRLMDASTQRLREKAQRAEQLSRLVSAGVIVVGLLLLIGLTLAFEGLARRARLAVDERRRLEALDIRDALTGLLNRTGLARSYAALDAGLPLAVVMADLNDLKSTNDVAGHSAGDQVLRRVAHALQRGLPPEALLARWGGDEFLAILPGTDRSGAETLLREVLRDLDSQHREVVTFAFGVGEAVSGEALDRPLAVADAAMYEHKARVRGTVVSGARHSTVEEFVAHLATLGTEHEILSLALPTARALLGFDVLLYVEGSAQGYHVRAFDSESLEVPVALLQGQSTPFAGGVIAAAMASGQTTWSNDYATDPRALPSLGGLRIKSCGASPMTCRGVAQGAVVIGHLRTWRPVTPQVRRVIETLALQLSDVRERHLMVSDLRRALEGGQRALGIALELRDLETAGHTERVVTLASELARALKLPQETQEILRQGAYLHDLGKLTVPDAVLLKPGRFTPEERAIMETHALRGYEIASQIAGLPQGTLEVIRSHHEKWDGTGYPARLCGEAIPLLARIFAVCDVYDALTSERPYKRAWSHQEALAEISAQSGRHFDPRVVQAFVELAPGAWRRAPGADTPYHVGQ
ncbi:sensor domain-containing diguanylate cyclase/phosphohydrolase [Deinococcus koreensis]|uniref:Diguanylate cyclase n=1 Tax=Deinococcus koreensis TaxID=2054903 RepID=A0A2K3UX22_9DEIO|nr:HD domain-containing phosphohydrolase [Deinococcus koreensis]PNY81089.1 hypothetical protein CVO96_06595 [Deinococcus koreensis]